MLALLFVGSSMFAQQAPPLDIALQHVRSNSENWGLSAQDIEGMTVSDMYTDEKTGISRVYFMQSHNNIPVYNAILNLNITKDGDVFYVGKRFVNGLASKINTTTPAISAKKAVQNLAAQLDIPFEELRLLDQDGQEFVFDKGNIAYEDIKVKLSFQPTDNEVLLAWDITWYPMNTSDMWSTRVDAVTGKILDEHNWTVYCNVDGRSFSRENHNCNDHVDVFQKSEKTTTANMLAGQTYNVWPVPTESPIHGPREMVEEPHDTIASPYAWHDIDGVDGAEFTITRGNNVHAYEDSGNANASAGNEPDGGTDLIFDFDWQDDYEPEQYTDAAIVNLFYMNNILHDFSYRHGFDEASGNFQTTNYTGMGLGTDQVNAEGQDGSGTNNANFSTPPDGQSGRMQMFRWDLGAQPFSIDEPASVAGEYEVGLPSAGNWGAGAYITDVPVVGEVVIIDDGTSEPLPSDGCEDILNGSELDGKVALIDRGGCEFGFKTVQAQDAGAIGVIICNFEDATIGMAPGAVGGDANIPVVFMSSVNCQAIRQFAGNGLIARFEQPAPVVPAQADSDLDNGIIAHEFGHGVSNRLTGGPSQAGCLGGSEQMGEGWSDFLSLVTTVQPGDTGSMKRGVGNYSIGAAPDGNGIRRFPYSTDMDINPLTYGSIPGEVVPHGVGAVWCSMIWDMYWAFSDQYGWDEDLFGGTGGNNMAIRLVIEGMKTQTCLPGFVDGRDAILAADMALYGGANQCLIWEVFANRGCGYSADQGTSDAVGDETEAFDLPCECRNKISISKSVSDFIQAGDDIDVTINVSNCIAETATGVKVTDQIPNGTQFVPGSANVLADVQGNAVTFTLNDMPFGSQATITYTLSTDPNKWSARYWIDEVIDDNADENWDIDYVGTIPESIWEITDAYGGYTSDFSWFAEDIETESIILLQLTPDAAWTVTGNRPVLRFFHKYDTEPAADGGVVDIKSVNDNTWVQVPDRMLRNGYPGLIQYGTFVVPNLMAYTGNSGDEFEATYVDLSDWIGQDVHIRFRFGTDDNTFVQNGGWLIDDIEFQDMLAYNGEVCITTAEGENECTVAPEEGTIVESQMATSTEEQLENVSILVYPNPVDKVLNVAIDSEVAQDLNLDLLTLDGKTVVTRTVSVRGNQNAQLNVSDIPAGFYFLKVSSDEGILVRKVVVQ